MSPKDILLTGFKKIKEYIASEKMNKIISILLIEMYRNPKVRDFFKKWYFEENINSINKLFNKMMEKGTIKQCDTMLLSHIYNALVNSFYQELFLYKFDNNNIEELEKKFEAQLVLFIDLLENNGGK